MRRVTSLLLLLLFIGTTAFAQNASKQLAEKLKMEQLRQGDVQPTANRRAVSNNTAFVPVTNFDPIAATFGNRDMVFAYNAYDPTATLVEGPITFDLSSPGTITQLAATTSTQFITGACWAPGDIWYGSQYFDGAIGGGIYEINSTDGTMTFIGGSGDYTSLAHDGNTLFASGATNLYEVDPLTGAETPIGPFGNAGTLMIAIACDASGQLYGIDLGDDSFYSIDKTTGAGTVIGLLGIDINYAQDMSIDKANGVCYLAGYTDVGGLYTIDMTTGVATFVGAFAGGSEITGFAIPYSYFTYTNDVGISAINQPVSGVELTDAEPVMFTIKNYGTEAQSNIDWEISWSGPAKNPVTGTYAGPLAAGETALIDAGTADLSAIGAYTFEACATITGDENPGNDCKTKVVNHSIPEYCDASTGNQDEYIANVFCGDIDNPSGWQGGVADYTDQSTTILAGMSEAITVTNGNAWSSDKVTVWVDWNADYEFGVGTDEEFVLVSVDGAETFTGDIEVPGGTPGGDYRMRVRMSYSSDPVPCGSMSYGEVEDYTITVSEGAENDLAVTAILSPETGYSLSNAEEVTIRIKNLGSLEQSGFDVSFSFDTDNPVTETVADVIAPGATLDYTFTATADLSAFGTYNFTACTELAGDQSPANDCKEKVIQNLAFGKISGSTKNSSTNGGLPGVLVEAGGKSVVSTGSPFGSFYTLDGLEAGTYTVTASMAGFFTSTYPGVVVTAGGTTTLNILLVPDLPQALPFMETWDDASFATNFWSFEPEQGNWKINASTGNPAPTARFNWSPSATDYEYSLVSRSMQGGAAKSIDVTLLDYDLYLNNYSITTVEGIAVELWDGAAWIEVYNHDNQNDDFPWTSFSHDITDLVSGLESFKIKFRAYGENSFNINYWELDNIHVYQATYVTFSGTITELSSGNPIEGASITLDEMRAEALTGPDGTYSISIPTGTYNVTLSADGYNTVVAEGVEVLDDFVWDVAMTAPTLEVTPDAFTETVEFGNSQDYTITVANSGNGPIDWTAQVQFITDAAKMSINIPASSASRYAESHGELVKPDGEATDAVWDLQFSYDAETVSGLTGLAGAESDGMYFYATKWANNQINKYELDGTFIETFTIPGVTGVRDLAYDGQYFYGGAASTTIFVMDFTNKTLVTTITSPGAVRAIAYDDVNDAFWCNNWDSDMLLVDRNGSQLNSIAGVPSMYGAAFDNHTAGGPFLWFFAGTTTGGGCWVEQWDIASGTFTGVMHSVSDDLGADLIAGGLFLVEDVVPGTYTLGGLAQGDPSLLFGYELGITVAPWLSLDMSSGTLTGSKESQAITMTLNTENLDLGQTYTANINFNGNPDVGMQTISVELFVGGDIGYIVGTVTDPVTRGPVRGVTITAEELRGFSTLTGDDGTYNLPVVGNASYNVMAEKEGYLSQMVEEVYVTTGEETIVDFALEFTAPVLLSAEASFFDVALEWEGNDVLEGKALRVDKSMLSAVAPDMEYLHGPTVKVPATSSRAVGDSCGNPIMVDMLPYTDQNTTCGRGNSADTTCLGYYDGGEDIFYEFTLTEQTFVRISMATTTTWTGMLLTDECPVTSQCIATATNTSSGGSQIEQVLEAGTYYIMIDTWPTPACIPDFTLTIEEVVECVVECPANALDEGEACGEDLNGGCNAEVPAYTPIACGDVYCGTAWADGGNRDTDWYELILEEPKTITWSVDAEFPVAALIVNGNMGCEGLTIIGQGLSDECGVPAVATATLIPGTYWLFVANQGFENSPCGFQNDYVAELTCEDAFITYFNLYRDGVEIAEVYGTSYLDEDVAGGNTYCYTVNQAFVGGETGMSNELCADVLHAPEIATDPTAVFETLDLGGTSTQVLNVENNGLGFLDFDVNVTLNSKDNAAPDVEWNFHKNVVGVSDQSNNVSGKTERNSRVDELLWDNLVIGSTNGIISNDLTGILPDGRTITADDFVIPAGETWTINYVYTEGFSNVSVLPDAFGVEFYADANGKPGTLISAEDVVPADINFATQDLTLSNPVVLSSGQYWISVYGVYEGSTGLTDTRWNWYTGTTPIGNEASLNDFAGLFGIGAGWFYLSEIGVADAPSCSFQIEGTKGGATSAWLTVDPLMGSIDGLGQFPLNLSFDAADLDPGTYNATISITSNDPLAPVVDVPVTLTVTGDFGVLSGVVTDPLSRGPVSGVTITAEELRASYTATTDENGFYEMEVAAGMYNVTAEKAGYAPQTIEGVEVIEDQTTTQNFNLEFAAPILQYATGGVGEISLGWTGNPAFDGGKARSGLSTNNQEETRTAKMSKEDQAHGPASIVPKATSGRAIGDDCDNPKILDMSTFPVVDNDSTCGHGNNYTETCLGNYDLGEDIVYQFTINETKDLEFVLTTVTTWTGMLITQECPIGQNCVASISSSSGNETLLATLDAGTYYLMIDTYASPDCIPEFTLQINEFIPEPGDLCSTAVTAVEGLNSAPQQPYWYEFTPTETKVLNISACIEGQSIDTKLEVYDACGGNLVASNDDLYDLCDYYNYASGVSFVATAGVSYKIFWLDSWSSAPFDFTIELEDPCTVECPPGAIAEGEVCPGDEYVDTFNGGCNSEVPVFSQVNCGDVVCGTASTYLFDGNNYRDTDWYELNITEPKSVTFNVTAEFPFIGGLIEQIEPGVAGCGNITGNISPFLSGAPCEEMSITMDLIPGTYYFFVSLGVFDGYPCGTTNNYVASWECADTFITYYDVMRDGDVIAQTYRNTYVDTDITPDVDYCYTVSQTIVPGLSTGLSNELCASMLCAEGCDYVMNFTDSYGDGWNGANVTVMLSGNVFGVYTLSGGAFGQEIVTLCDGLDLALVWAPGPYPGECGFEMLDASGNVLVSFLAGGAPVAGEFYSGVTACPVSAQQDISLEPGWNAWSSYIEPTSKATMEDILASIVDDMIVTQYFTELYYPEYGINTFGDFHVEHGYFTKMANAAVLTVTGEMANLMVSLTAGWNLMPVAQECSIDAADVFANLPGLIIAWDPVGNGIYYPAGNLNTLGNLMPGMAYWVKVDADVDYTFPGCQTSDGSGYSSSLRAVNNTNWNDVNYTSINHAVVFNTSAVAGLQEGDMIGAFTSNGWCAGLVEFTGENFGFNLFGDDMTTENADGFIENENLSFRLFRPATKEEFDLKVTYSFEAPNANGLYAINGLSVVTDLKMTATNIGATLLNGLNIYPNPSSGIFNIAIGNIDEDINYVVLNAQGQEVYSGSLLDSQELDLSAEPKGVYFIKFMNDSVLGVEKLVIR